MACGHLCAPQHVHNSMCTTACARPRTPPPSPPSPPPLCVGAHQVLEVYWRRSQLWGTIEVLPTPSGLLLRELYAKVGPCVVLYCTVSCQMYTIWVKSQK
jgi:hypothetical protein